MSVTDYMWDELTGALLSEKDDGVPGALYTMHPSNGSVVSQRRNGTSKYYEMDGRESTRELTNSSEQITDSETYTVFGEQLSHSGPTTNPFRFRADSHYYLDVDTSTYSNDGRTYDPLIGRWLSCGVRHAGIASCYAAFGERDSDPVTVSKSYLRFNNRTTQLAAVFSLPSFLRCVPRLQFRPIGPLRPFPPFFSRPQASIPAPDPLPEEWQRPQDQEWWDTEIQNYLSPGRCTLARHDELRTQKENACDQPAARICKHSWIYSKNGCKNLSNMEDKWRKCSRARMQIAKECFGGGNNNHRTEIREAWKHANDCQNLFFKWCGNGGGGPQRIENTKYACFRECDVIAMDLVSEG